MVVIVIANFTEIMLKMVVGRASEKIYDYQVCNSDFVLIRRSKLFVIQAGVNVARLYWGLKVQKGVCPNQIALYIRDILSQGQLLEANLSLCYRFIGVALHEVVVSIKQMCTNC
ncbi:MAG: hypothetical protein EZS28_027988 [Streblomastix strix]|uniref:Uncharacterized protein n=1 Tax=Streblomastix strix TaxID=222440 RepID=A0A5J4V181_9EUKA|nr:MAG: hypothetical protein EZS28_027988 [Streblomastix strix]